MMQPPFIWKRARVYLACKSTLNNSGIFKGRCSDIRSSLKHVGDFPFAVSFAHARACVIRCFTLFTSSDNINDLVKLVPREYFILIGLEEYSYVC